MMGRDHALSGALAGLGAAELTPSLTGQPLTLPAIVLAALVVAGAAFLPDLDHPSATIAHTWGPVSRWAARMLNDAGKATWSATRTRRDQPIRDGHRTLSHTLVFAAVSGGLVGGAALLGGPWVVVATLYLTLTLALRGLGLRRALRSASRVAYSYRARRTLRELARLSEHVYGAAIALAFYPAAHHIDPWLLGGAIAFGCWVHCLGDSCTLYGCPWLWPVPIAGQRWYRIGTPRWMRFRTGTEEFDGEDRLRVAMWLGIVVLVINLVPGSWTAMGHGAAAGWNWATG